MMAISARTSAAIAAVAGCALVVGLGYIVQLDVIAEEFDAEWADTIVGLRSAGWEVGARMFDFLGGGWVAHVVVPVLGATAFLLARRPWSALAFTLSVVATSAVVPLVKMMFGRARPDQILVPVGGTAYPSGHTAIAASVCVALILLVGRWQAVVIGVLYVLLMALSRTYLGAHWVSDTIGGALLGASVALGVWAILAPRIRAEKKPGPSPTSSEARAANESR